MTYADGQQVRLGDRVDLGGHEGEVVAIIHEAAYADGFSHGAWAYLGSGVLVRFEAYGLIHYRAPEDDLVLLARQGA